MAFVFVRVDLGCGLGACQKSNYILSLIFLVKKSNMILVSYSISKIEMLNFTSKLKFEILVQNWNSTFYSKIEIRYFGPKLKFDILVQNWNSIFWSQIEIQNCGPNLKFQILVQNWISKFWFKIKIFVKNRSSFLYKSPTLDNSKVRPK